MKAFCLILLLELPTIVDPQRDPLRVRSAVDDTILLRCEAKGTPPPTVSVIFRGSTLSSESSNSSVATKRIVVNENSVGDYICLAKNRIVSPSGDVDPKTVTKHVLVDIEGKEISLTRNIIHLYLYTAESTEELPGGL